MFTLTAPFTSTKQQGIGTLDRNYNDRVAFYNSLFGYRGDLSIMSTFYPNYKVFGAVYLEGVGITETEGEDLTDRVTEITDRGLEIKNQLRDRINKALNHDPVDTKQDVICWDVIEDQLCLTWLCEYNLYEGVLECIHDFLCEEIFCGELDLEAEVHCAYKLFNPELKQFDSWLVGLSPLRYPFGNKQMVPTFVDFHGTSSTLEGS